MFNPVALITLSTVAGLISAAVLFVTLDNWSIRRRVRARLAAAVNRAQGERHALRMGRDVDAKRLGDCAHSKRESGDAGKGD